MMAPTERSMSVVVIPQLMSVVDLWNCAASGVRVKLTEKKSNASHVQPRKPTYRYISDRYSQEYPKSSTKSTLPGRRATAND